MSRRKKWFWADDTPVKMQNPGSEEAKTARVWTYARDEHPIRHLAGCRGWMPPMATPASMACSVIKRRGDGLHD